MSVVTWLHISDWHQTTDDKENAPREKVVEALKRDIDRLRNASRIEEIDFFVFGGDIAYGGKDDEYQRAQKRLIDPLLSKAHLEPKQCVFVPGNHDVDGSQIHSDFSTPHQILQHEELKRIRQAKKDAAAQGETFGEVYDALLYANKWTTDTHFKECLRQPFEAFRKFAANYKADADWAYTKTFTIRETSVEIFALNTALYCGRKRAGGERADYGGLFLGAGQKSVFPESVRTNAPGRLRLAVLHHPVSWLCGAEQQEMHELLYQGMDFVLVGHEHWQRVEEIGSTIGDVVVLPAGPLFDKELFVEEAASDRRGISYSVVRLEWSDVQKTWEGRAYLRRWYEESGEFKVDTRQRVDIGDCYIFRSLNIVQDRPLPLGGTSNLG